MVTQVLEIEVNRLQAVIHILSQLRDEGDTQNAIERPYSSQITTSRGQPLNASIERLRG